MRQIKARPRKGTQSLARSIRLLKMIARHQSDGVRIVDLVRMTGIERPTVHRMLDALVEEGLVQRPPQSHSYVLGEYCRELAVAFHDRSDLRSVCEPVLRRISEATGDSAFLVVPVGTESLCVARSIGNHPVQVLAVKVGHCQPLGVGAGGLAILSSLSREERENVYRQIGPRLSSYGDMTLGLLKAAVTATQRRGYAVIGHYSVPGVIAIGVALRNAAGEVIGAISTGSIDARMTPRMQQEAAECVLREVAMIQPHLDVLPNLSLRARAAAPA